MKEESPEDEIPDDNIPAAVQDDEKEETAAEKIRRFLSNVYNTLKEHENKIIGLIIILVVYSVLSIILSEYSRRWRKKHGREHDNCEELCAVSRTAGDKDGCIEAHSQFQVCPGFLCRRDEGVEMGGVPMVLHRGCQLVREQGDGEGWPDGIGVDKGEYKRKVQDIRRRRPAVGCCRRDET